MIQSFSPVNSDLNWVSCENCIQHVSKRYFLHVEHTLTYLLTLMMNQRSMSTSMQGWRDQKHESGQHVNTGMHFTFLTYCYTLEKPTMRWLKLTDQKHESGQRHGQIELLLIESELSKYRRMLFNCSAWHEHAIIEGTRDTSLVSMTRACV